MKNNRKRKKEKQNYLRQNILDKGYDANEFVSFLISKKGEAASDISNWSMIDLHAVVQEFILKHENENKANPQSQDNKNNQSQKEKIANEYEIIENNDENINENNNQKNRSNSKKLELNKTVREATLTEGSIILVVDAGPMTGGF